MQCKYKFTINEMTKVELNIIFKIRNILTPITKNKEFKKKKKKNWYNMSIVIQESRKYIKHLKQVLPYFKSH